MSSSDTEPPSDPEVEREEPTRIIVRRLEKRQQRADGAATVWRGLGGLAVTVALALAGWGVTYAQQAAVDHVRVERLEADVAAMRGQLAELLRQQADAAQALARIEGRLDRREE